MPDTVAFDLNGTLLDPSALARPLGDRDEDRALIERAFGETIEQAMAVALAGEVRPFAELLRAAVRRQLELSARTDDPGAVVEQASAMPPFPGAAEALDRLSAARLRLAVLSNSDAQTARENLAHADLEERFDVVVGADEAGTFKPAAQMYQTLLDRLDCDAGAVWLVSAHWWDVLGARVQGLRTAWVARPHRVLPATAGTPDVVADDLLGVADRIARSHA